MKNLLFISASLAISAAAAITQSPTAAMAGGIGNNYIAPGVTFGGGQTVFGIQSKLGIADNVSLRPFVTFPVDNTQFGTSITYDWDLRQSSVPITPFVGVGIAFQTASQNNTTAGFAQVGADLNVNESFSLLTSVAIPFNSNNASTSVNVAAGLRF
jgi:opacity protein-like surface antigen